MCVDFYIPSTYECVRHMVCAQISLQPSLLGAICEPISTAPTAHITEKYNKHTAGH